MSLHAVIFDFYGTLTPSRSAAEQHAARAAQADALGIDVDVLDTGMTATITERFCGAGTTVEGSLAWVAARVGATPSDAELAEAATLRLDAERRFGVPRRDAVEVLWALRRRGLKIGLVSDCSAELPRYFAELPIAALVDAPVFSFVLGVKKPAAAIYLACCAALSVDPGDCLYVGDGGSNELAGARDVGMRAVHLAVPGEAGSVVYGRHASWDGETVTSLAQVTDLVG